MKMTIEAASAETLSTNGPTDVGQGREAKRDRFGTVIPYCEADGKGHDSSCDMTESERSGLLQTLRGRTLTVESLYKDALLIVRMNKLVEKPDDVDWVQSLILEVAGLTLSALVFKGLTRLGESIAKSSNLPAVVARTVTFAKKHVNEVEKQTEKGVEKAVEGGAHVIEHGSKQSGERLETQEKAEASSYINYLYNAATVGFQALREDAPGQLSDAELRVLRDTLAGDAQDINVYIRALTEKLKRYEESDVTAIGRKPADRDTGQKTRYGAVTRDVTRDTRVAWHVYKSGFPRQLVFEHQDRDANFSYDAAKNYLAGKQMTFGAGNTLTENPERGATVPDEFAQVAIARHEATWGGPPPIIIIDDTQWLDPMRMAAAARAKGRNP